MCSKKKIGLAVPLLSDTSLSDIIKIFYMIHQQYSVVIVWTLRQNKEIEKLWSGHRGQSHNLMPLEQKGLRAFLVQGPNNGSLPVPGLEPAAFWSVAQRLKHWTTIAANASVRHKQGRAWNREMVYTAKMWKLER